MDDERDRDDDDGLAAEAGRVIEDAERAEAGAVVGLGRYRDHPVVRAAGTLSELADQPQLAALCGTVAAWGLLTGNRRLARCGGHMMASFLLATGIKSVAKSAVARTRPNVWLDRGVHEVGLGGPDEGPWNSFPSGHTAGAVAAARAAARVYPRAALPAYGAAAAVAAAQVPRCAHYPSDVAAGAVIGLAAEAAARRLFPLVRRLSQAAGL